MENVEMKIENQKIQIKNLEAKNKKLKDTNMDLQVAIVELKCENKKLEDSKDNLKAFIKRQYEVIQSITEKHNTEIVNAQKTIDEKNKIISGLEHDVKNLKNGNDLLRKSIYVRDRKIPDMQKDLLSKDKDIQALMDQLDARDREIEKYKFMIIHMADDLYGKGDLDRGEEEDE